jgi:hypothetical protein
VRRDDRYGTTVKGNDGDEWSSNGVVLWLVRRQNRDDFFIAVEGGSGAVWVGWPAAMVQIQNFSFGSRGESTG